jgi:hypothetical protein
MSHPVASMSSQFKRYQSTPRFRDLLSRLDGRTRQELLQILVNPVAQQELEKDPSLAQDLA